MRKDQPFSSFNNRKISVYSVLDEFFSLVIFFGLLDYVFNLDNWVFISIVSREFVLSAGFSVIVFFCSFESSGQIVYCFSQKFFGRECTKTTVSLIFSVLVCTFEGSMENEENFYGATRK